MSFLLFFLLMPGFAEAKKAAPAPDTALLPHFSQMGGAFSNSVTVSLQGPSQEEKVVYTLDGSEPTLSSPIFSTPLLFTNSTLVRARALRPSQELGPVRSEHFLVLGEDSAPFSSNLPLVVIDTLGVEPSRDHKDAVSIRFVEPGEPRTRLLGPAQFDGRVLLNIRGRASLRYPKRSYTLKLIDESNQPRPASLLGFAKDEDWILYAPYPDKTLMRDVLAYEMGRALGHWTPGTRFVEVFVTDGRTRLSRSDYVGVYVLEERIKRSSHRIDLEKLTPAMVDEPEVTGGYIFKKDHVDRGYFGPPDLLGGGTYVSSSSGKPGFPTPAGGFPALSSGFLPAAIASISRFRGESTETFTSSSSSRRSTRNQSWVTNILTSPVPREPETGPRMVSYDNEGTEITEKLEEGFATNLRTNQFYWVVPEEDEVTPVQRAWLKRHLDRFEATLYSPGFVHPDHGYSAFIDIPSFIDYHLVTEVTKNVDGHRFSTFFTKDRGGKIRMEPMWDWNLSFGNCNGKQGWMPEFWLWPQLTDQEYSWFRRLFDDPDFGQRYVDRWDEMQRSVFNSARLIKRIDELAGLLQESQQRNFDRWPILGKGVNPNYFVGESYDEEVEWMKKWLRDRLAWIQRQFVPVPQAETRIAPDGARKILWQAGAGEIHYCLDGQDPRSPGGNVSPTALHNTEDIWLPKNGTLVARRRLDGLWSAPLRISPVP